MDAAQHSPDIAPNPLASPVRAVVRFTSRMCLVLCPMGHVITGKALDSSWGGSMFAADVASQQHGSARTGWDRLAAECDGAGHVVAARAVAP